jgi:hypothetical protein
MTTALNARTAVGPRDPDNVKPALAEYIDNVPADPTGRASHCDFPTCRHVLSSCHASLRFVADLLTHPNHWM